MRKTYTTFWLAASVAACVLIAVPAMAQTPAVPNPNTVSFTPSADHDALGLDGQPMVTGYEMRIALESGGPVLFVSNLGKPTPINNLIEVTNAVWFAGLTPKTRYVARVAALGPSGEGVSDPSGPFGLVGPAAAPTNVKLIKR